MIQDKKLGDFMSRYLALATQSKEENRMHTGVHIYQLKGQMCH